jgi:anionic cell wall polymer biosynthesis LytR-Cps2A-Psr (LCP) family protein
MARQRCTINAIIDAADPVTVLSKYQQLAQTTQDIISTDIPQSALSDFVDLGFLVKDAQVRSVVFDNTLINPAYPDYDQIRSITAQALSAPAASSTSPSSTSPSSTSPSPSTTATPTSPSAGEAPPPSGSPVTDVGDACAYDPAKAQAELAQGKPPSKAG